MVCTVFSGCGNFIQPSIMSELLKPFYRMMEGEKRGPAPLATVDLSDLVLYFRVHYGSPCVGARKIGLIPSMWSEIPSTCYSRNIENVAERVVNTMRGLSPADLDLKNGYDLWYLHPLCSSEY